MKHILVSLLFKQVECYVFFRILFQCLFAWDFQLHINHTPIKAGNYKWLYNIFHVLKSEYESYKFVFFRYLKKKQEANLEKKLKKEEEEDESDVSSVASDEFNEMLDNMMGGKETDLNFADDLEKSSSKKHKG